jgi:hypothetical protein
MRVVMAEPHYKGWARWGRLWQQVTEGPDMQTCYRTLLAIIRQRGKVPLASAVLPAGRRPTESSGGK